MHACVIVSVQRTCTLEPHYSLDPPVPEHEDDVVNPPHEPLIRREHDVNPPHEPLVKLEHEVHRKLPMEHVKYHRIKKKN